MGRKSRTSCGMFYLMVRLRFVSFRRYTQTPLTPSSALLLLLFKNYGRIKIVDDPM